MGKVAYQNSGVETLEREREGKRRKGRKEEVNQNLETIVSVSRNSCVRI